VPGGRRFLFLGPTMTTAFTASDSREGPCGQGGARVVLTADRTLMADYRVLFDGMLAASQTTRVPSALMKALMAPRLRGHDSRAVAAPLGLRRIEAALVADGWERGDVAVVPPERLREAVGAGTRVVGLSSGDPLGIGMTSTTMAALLGGEPYTGKWFRGLCRRVGRLLASSPGARVVMGGPGAWQLARDGAARRALGVDHVITGYCEANVVSVLGAIAAGQDLPPVIEGVAAPAGEVPAVLGPTVMGGVEIGRGCGLGCDFCSLARIPMQDLAEDTILSDVETNVTAGAGSVFLTNEDLFRYGARGGQVTPGALIGLLERIRAAAGSRFVQADHANVQSVAGFNDAELAAVGRLLAGGEGRAGYTWVNVGVESASGRLLAENGCGPKMTPFGPDGWAGACQEQVRRLIRAGFFPLLSLVVGIPGETEKDVADTIRWVEDLGEERVAVFPVLHVHLGDNSSFGRGQMSAAHWRLFRLCYRLNFKWMPRLTWDNERRAGVGIWRRLLIQFLGRVNIPWWKALFLLRSAGARP